MANRISRVKAGRQAKPEHQIKPNLLEKKLKAVKAPFRRAFITQKWAANKPEHRKLIRKKLFALTKDPQVLELSTVSKWDSGYFSISHNPSYGALVTAKQPIGIDIEQTQRVISARVLARIASPQEQELGLTPIEIWAAKESAFKAYSALYKIRTISEINIRGVKKNISSKTFKFSFISSKNSELVDLGWGCVFNLRDTTMGIAWLKA
ncbi:MAG: 4'-phosphopantetheinyl transferase superfamily protein [Bdellovibrionota bacterium]